MISNVVRKPQRANTPEQQCAMLTEDIFKTIYGSERFMKRILIKEKGRVFPLHYPGHNYIYSIGGEKLVKIFYFEGLNAISLLFYGIFGPISLP